jgi:hypothetical protein
MSRLRMITRTHIGHERMRRCCVAGRRSVTVGTGLWVLLGGFGPPRVFTLVVIDGARHLPNLEQPRAFNDAREFLTTV